ncbi:hypothetical protein AA0119_g11368 [Alternaria tenuissima]|uniref:Heterokaryon incompatibility domain-containing protein n=1 Tax=Alternaria tenuissima TaxID=119927 RepID=A0ABY0FWJ7_9PLEO|nr:hypothetical protein AA0120_g8838 [Alternaria tenuissima]RYN89407.1 hypothetical protein AA0119_g11368 [Alternaria tenuissima]RYO13026.1 hypothetical protein AA0121_g8780 [Alternaria tenuissima]
MFNLLDRDKYLAWQSRSLAEMLRWTQRFEKTESSDSIYAILGLIDLDKALAGNEAALLEVDYTKPLPDVLRDATRYGLCELNNLNILRAINHRDDALTDSQTFPTWTLRPDLLHSIEQASLLSFFDACEGLETPSLLSDVSFGESVLLLQGIVVDQTVQTTVVCHRDVLEDDEGFHQWLASMKDMMIHHGNIAMQENIDLAIASTLVAGQAKSGKDVQPADLQVLVEYIKSLAIREDMVTDDVSIRPHFDIGRMWAVFKTVNVSCCKDRRFFVTAAGYMGLGPRCMQPEDIVVVLRGGHIPYILRKKVDGYQLIGQAYVHGIMYGEAVELDRSRGGSEMVFHVR